MPATTTAVQAPAQHAHHMLTGVYEGRGLELALIPGPEFMAVVYFSKKKSGKKTRSRRRIKSVIMSARVVKYCQICEGYQLQKSDRGRYTEVD
jgi:hypothetical protein